MLVKQNLLAFVEFGWAVTLDKGKMCKLYKEFLFDFTKSGLRTPQGWIHDYRMGWLLHGYHHQLALWFTFQFGNKYCPSSPQFVQWLTIRRKSGKLQKMVALIKEL